VTSGHVDAGVVLTDHVLNFPTGRLPPATTTRAARGLAELPEPGHVEVELAGGDVLEATVRRAVGHPERPMSVDEQTEKFRWCAAVLGARRVDAIAEAVLCLPQLTRVSELAALLDPAY
jgi:2-methylcitrate dehydratase PrpD